jgi:hypothetical protein
MDTLLLTGFTDQTAEFANFASQSVSEDLMDQPLLSGQVPQFQGNSAQNYYLTSSPNSMGGFSEIEFNLANTFWGCPFNFGNNQCGKDIRQGIAHMVDRQKFASTEPGAYSYSAAIDNPQTADNGGLPTPNPCAWDASFAQSGPSCAVGAAGGTAYRRASATGANGFQWLQAPGSLDLNAAAYHFVLAGAATGCDGGTGAVSCTASIDSKLSGVVNANIPTFLIRSDSPALFDLGNGLAQEICYLFTGSFTMGCTYLNIYQIPLSAFVGLTTSTSTVSNSWWMYTAGPSGYAGLDVFSEVPEHLGDLGDCGTLIGCDPFDTTLYFGFNSRFTSVPPVNQPPNGSCSSYLAPSVSAPDYMYLCSPVYDTISALMEHAACITVRGDPVAGQTTPSYASCQAQVVSGMCTSTSACSAATAAYQAEDVFGKNAFTIPIIGSESQQYVYLAHTPGQSATWQRVVNSPVSGPSNYFTWLNAYNSQPAQSGTIRQAMAPAPGHSLNPYAASTSLDLMIVTNVYDTLAASNPLVDTQLIDWMASSVVAEDNATVISQAGYQPPSGTSINYHFTLRPGIFFQDGRPVTPFDVAFSYLTLKANGAFLGAGAEQMTGITVLGRNVFDIGVNANGISSLISLESIPILDAIYWTGAGEAAWSNGVDTCNASCYPAQYTLQPGNPQPICTPTLSCTIHANQMVVSSRQLTATYDPLSDGKLIGSGPWGCRDSTGKLGVGCSSTGFMNPPPGQSYTLTRFGKGLAPASSTSGIYFRSSGDLALWIWSQENDANPIVAVSAVSLCFNQPLNFGSCAHWQQGIGASMNGIVGATQVSEVEFRYNINWITPYNWANAAPTGIGALPPVLYEGSYTLNPASVVGCPSGYDC